MATTPVFLPGKSHGQRSLVGCSSWSHKELGTTERLTLPFRVNKGKTEYQEKIKPDELMTVIFFFYNFCL